MTDVWERIDEAGIDSSIVMDSVYDRVLEEWGFTYDEWYSRERDDCMNGHYECSYRPGGPCMGEVASRYAVQVAEEYLRRANDD